MQEYILWIGVSNFINSENPQIIMIKEEEIKVRGEELLKKVKEIIHEGNVRKITIKDKDGKVIVVFPLTLGVVGAVLAPMFAAIGALAALLTECTITIEKKE